MDHGASNALFHYSADQYGPLFHSRMSSRRLSLIQRYRPVHNQPMAITFDVTFSNSIMRRRVIPRGHVGGGAAGSVECGLVRKDRGIGFVQPHRCTLETRSALSFQGGLKSRAGPELQFGFFVGARSHAPHMHEETAVRCRYYES